MQYPSPYSIRAISEAIQKDLISTLDRLFGEMPDPGRVMPALCGAISSGVSVKIQTVEFVIKALPRLGIDIDSDGGVLLRTCIMTEDISLVGLCLKFGATPNGLVDEGLVPRSPLETAVSLGWDDDRRSRPRDLSADARAAAIIDLLLEKGADLSEKGVICRAAAHRSPDVIKKLIERGGDVHDRNERGKTPLFFCADSLPAAQYLVSQGADANARDVDGETPLMAAAQSWKPDMDMIRLLLRSGTEINAQNKFGRTALMFAASARCKPVIDALIRHGADRAIKNNLGKTALDLAEEADIRDADVVELLKPVE